MSSTVSPGKFILDNEMMTNVFFIHLELRSVAVIHMRESLSNKGFNLHIMFLKPCGKEHALITVHCSLGGLYLCV